jgi:hypothetical protein
MKSEIRYTLLSAALAALTLPGLAQNTAASAQGSGSASTPVAQGSASASVKGQDTGSNIQARKENQQDRIANGVKSGELTAGETSNLENKETKLNQEERDMRKLDNGKLTAADKATLNQQQNQLSKQIYQDKHNAATQNADPTSKAGKRAENQQDRIANGIQSGQLSAKEAAHLENNQAKINQEVHADRQANGGKLTAQERAQVNRQQNRQSRQIYNAKHNGRR